MFREGERLGRKAKTVDLIQHKQTKFHNLVMCYRPHADLTLVLTMFEANHDTREADSRAMRDRKKTFRPPISRACLCIRTIAVLLPPRAASADLEVPCQCVAHPRPKIDGAIIGLKLCSISRALLTDCPHARTHHCCSIQKEEVGNSYR